MAIENFCYSEIMQRLYRSRTDRVMAGICGGLGNYYNIDPTILRLIFVLLLLFTGIIPLLIAYIIALFIIPLEPTGTPALQRKKLKRSSQNKMIAGICGGIAETVNADPTIVRLVAVFLCFLSGVIPLVIAYLIAWVIIPKR